VEEDFDRDALLLELFDVELAQARSRDRIISAG